MLHAVSKDENQPYTESKLPAQRQPWELAMVVLGLPGAAAAALGTSALAVLGGTTDPLIGIAGIATVLGLYLTTMFILWVGTSAELG